MDSQSESEATMTRQIRHSRRPLPKWAAALAALAILGAIWGVGSAMVSHAGGRPGHHDENGSQGHYLNVSLDKFDRQRSAKTDSRGFFLGDAVIMPDGVSLQVNRVERNWKPSAAIQAAWGDYPVGDDPRGKETILVWFTATNVGTSPLGYNELGYSLKLGGGPEQRVARLATLRPGSHGSQNHQPWLLPGESMTTCEAFFVHPGEAPSSFQYYYVKEIGASIDTIVMYRLSFALQDGGRAPGQFTFVPNRDITVR